MDSVCITFDKMDKIGLSGVKEELTDKGFDCEVVERFVKFLSDGDFTLETIGDMLEDNTPAKSLSHIIGTVKELSGARFDVVFDLSLVRGQGYYLSLIHI